MKRRLARAVSVLAVAVLLGHFVQTVSENKPAQATGATPASDPKIIVPVAAGPQSSVTPRASATLPVAASPVEGSSADVLTDDIVGGPAPTPVIANMAGVSVLPILQPVVTLAATTPTDADAPPAIVSTKAAEPSIVPKAMEILLQPEDGCQNEMDLYAVADAIIEITLLSPCHPNERLVLRHGPLALTVKTTPQGSAFLKIPALDGEAQVSLRFVDGTVIDGTVQVPDLARQRRFAVQWQDSDTFGLNAFEGGSDYGGAGHISAANPGKLPLTGSADGGYLMILGDAEVIPAMLAEVYTYPTRISGPVEISIEAEVTATSCGRELLGEVITSDGGQSVVSDLMLAMPDCSAMGDILVLKNPVQDLTLAVAN